MTRFWLRPRPGSSWKDPVSLAQRVSVWAALLLRSTGHQIQASTMCHQCSKQAPHVSPTPHPHGPRKCTPSPCATRPGCRGPEHRARRGSRASPAFAFHWPPGPSKHRTSPVPRATSVCLAGARTHPVPTALESAHCLPVRRGLVVGVPSTEHAGGAVPPPWSVHTFSTALPLVLARPGCRDTDHAPPCTLYELVPAPWGPWPGLTRASPAATVR